MNRCVLLALMVHVGGVQARFFPGDGPMNPTKRASVARDQDAAGRTLREFEARMAPLAESRGGRLRVVVEPDDRRVNAFAAREGQDWNVIFYGGMLEHPAMGEAELALVFCHELGHHMGGAPTAARGGWSSCEGQADWWSTRDCFARLGRNDGAAAALALTAVYADYSGESAPALQSRDTTRVPRTHYGYPSAQCRLDTLLAGLEGAERPACWYAGP